MSASVDGNRTDNGKLAVVATASFSRCQIAAAAAVSPSPMAKVRALGEYDVVSGRDGEVAARNTATTTSTFLTVAQDSVRDIWLYPCAWSTSIDDSAVERACSRSGSCGSVNSDPAP